MKIVCSSVRGEITRSVGVKSRGGRPATEETPTLTRECRPSTGHLLHDVGHPKWIRVLTWFMSFAYFLKLYLLSQAEAILLCFLQIFLSLREKPGWQSPFSSAFIIFHTASSAHLPKESVRNKMGSNTKYCSSGKEISLWRVTNACIEEPLSSWIWHLCHVSVKRSWDSHVRYSPASRLPVAAVQPMTGGMAPTTAPTHVLAMLILFNGV